jgi:large subunit ribosomal protein L31
VKEKIHPKYYPEARVVCACGNTWVTGSTKELLKADICSKCHPFFTGQQMRLLDLGGQVDRFTKRVETAQKLREEAGQRQDARNRRKRERALVEIVDEDESVEPIQGLAEDDDAKA